MSTRYTAPRWLPGGHSQTVWPALFVRGIAPRYRRELWNTPDGGTIALDFVDAANPDAPLVILFHGLEGSSSSHYARALMHKTAARGWHGVVPHFRGCGGVDNTLPRAYHAGDSAEIAWILAQLKGRFRTLFVSGVSLGGNMLLKYLGEYGSQALAHAAVTISVPYNLETASEQLDRGLSRLIYTERFLSTLKHNSQRLWQHHPGLFDAERAQRSRTFREFDEYVTAPLHGFAGAQDYWTRSSSHPFLRHIALPTLLINAKNDPFLPASALPRAATLAPCIETLYPEQGGHAGFVGGRFPGHVDWLPEQILAHFTHHLR